MVLCSRSNFLSAATWASMVELSTSVWLCGEIPETKETRLPALMKDCVIAAPRRTGARSGAAAMDFGRSGTSSEEIKDWRSAGVVAVDAIKVLLENGIWPIAWSNHGWGVLFAPGSTAHRER